MALTIAQIITLALQDSNCPGFTSQGGQKLNLVLQELAQDYNFFSAQGWVTGAFLTSPPTATVNSANVVAGSGPYALPSDFLRFDFHDFFWQNGGINYFPTPLDMDEFDNLVQQAGFSSYPTAYAVDMSTSPPGLYIWPAANGAYPYFGRYHKQQPDIATPETSNVVPWFPNQMYILRRLTAEMMLTTGDTRARAVMDDAEAILNRYIKKEGNQDNRGVTVKLDPRKFGASWWLLRSTKQVPW